MNHTKAVWDRSAIFSKHPVVKLPTIDVIDEVLLRGVDLLCEGQIFEAGLFIRDYLANDDQYDNSYQVVIKRDVIIIGFRMTCLHLTLAHYKRQGQDRTANIVEAVKDAAHTTIAVKHEVTYRQLVTRVHFMVCSPVDTWLRYRRADNPSVRPSVCPSVSPSVRPSVVRPSVRPSVRSSSSLRPSVRPSGRLFASPSVRQSLHNYHF